MRNTKLTLEEKLEVIDLYFGEGQTIMEISRKLGYSKSVVGRVTILHKEKYINGDKSYVPYPQHYYRKNKKLIKLKNDITNVLNKEFDLIEEKNRLQERLSQIEEEFEQLMDKKYNLLNR